MAAPPVHTGCSPIGPAMQVTRTSDRTTELQAACFDGRHFKAYLFGRYRAAGGGGSSLYLSLNAVTFFFFCFFLCVYYWFLFDYFPRTKVFLKLRRRILKMGCSEWGLCLFVAWTRIQNLNRCKGQSLKDKSIIWFKLSAAVWNVILVLGTELLFNISPELLPKMVYYSLTGFSCTA